MKTTVKGFVHAETALSDGKPRFTIYPFDMSDASSQLALLGEQFFEVEVPDDFDIRPALVASLEREKQSVLATAQAKVTQIEGQIRSLLAIKA